MSNCVFNKDIVRELKREKKLASNIDECLFSSIIKRINELILEEMLKGYIFVLPYKLGELYLQRKVRKVVIKKGNIKKYLAIDWKRTLELWKDKPECKLKKQLIYFNPGEAYKIKYDKTKAYYTNKVYYRFKLNRNLYASLNNERINEIQISYD